MHRCRLPDTGARAVCPLRESPLDRSALRRGLPSQQPETVAAAARHRRAVLGDEPSGPGGPIWARYRRAARQAGIRGCGGAANRRCSGICCRATADTTSRVLGGIDVGSLVTAVEGGSAVTTGGRVSAKDVLAAVPGLPVVDRMRAKLGAESEGSVPRHWNWRWRRYTWPSALTKGLQEGPDRL